MKILIRLLFTFLSLIAGYYFIFWVPFSLIPIEYRIIQISVTVSFIVAVMLAVFVWKKTKKMPEDLATFIFMGGIILGSIGFVAGFIGPIIFSPSANQGPLLGIFITGPLGFLTGLLVGGVYWLIKGKKKKYNY